MNDIVIRVFPDREPEQDTIISIYQLDEGPGLPWTVSGDLRAPGTGWSDDANYEIRDALRASGVIQGVDYDPESSCFFAYVDSLPVAESLAAAIANLVKIRQGVDTSGKGE